jgi:Na+/melibiose symporter-like transporter
MIRPPFSPAGWHQHDERGQDSEGGDEAMTDEERPKTRMKYEAGFKRILAVLAVCWAVFCLIVVAAIFQHRQGPLRPGDETAVGIFLAAAVFVLVLGYVFFFKVVPWIIERFESLTDLPPR